jgi:hypothetical protein
MSEIVVAQPAANASQTVPLADCSPAEQIQLRFATAVSALFDEAVETESPRILADVLTWTLARMVVTYNAPFVAADILRRLGAHIETLSDRRRALEEAAKEREEGRAPH